MITYRYDPMISIVIFALFVYVFWFPAVFKRILLHSYLWQIKEYRWDRMSAYIAESKSLSLHSLPTVIASVLVLGTLLLATHLDSIWL